MRPLALAVALVATFASGTQAQVRPQPGGGDPRLQSIAYRPEQVVMLEVATGYQLSLEFAPDEAIESVAVGDSGAWAVVPTKRGGHLFIKPVLAGVSTNMTVVTDARTYLFDLQPLPGPSPDMAYTVRFTYPRAAAAMQSPAGPARAVVETLYRVHGDRMLQPAAISDDGTATYIRWPDEAALPAVYAVDARGRETLVNGMMRDGLYVIDGVSRRLRFRIDDRTALAVRRSGRNR
ncbi:TrbG/VirB9 family P-type conjugative transfer protein [Sphingomonas sp.]|uniref:TrbG/VirB9 family P-type conjugative transfer protein n=1 Tax=Sphingomonas sp. TaxID=28214 RepID=UPI001EBCD77E|nr:TrbG/VirB9 family P-type conjugative transfer protein [Sphingomonas sp.]MBX3594143.1 TrbG/VirB9 family P-type conjugative transfer protein [Sphingomonas sp.]